MASVLTVVIARYVEHEHGPGVQDVLESLGWERRYVDGQLAGVADLAASPDGCVYVALDDGRVSGYVAALFAEWNRLGQIHGLAVAPAARRRGVAGMLVGAVEDFLRERHARGVRVDTPVDNVAGRAFYDAVGFTADCVMTRYYADDLDGVTYVRFFHEPV